MPTNTPHPTNPPPPRRPLGPGPTRPPADAPAEPAPAAPAAPADAPADSAPAPAPTATPTPDASASPAAVRAPAAPALAGPPPAEVPAPPPVGVRSAGQLPAELPAPSASASPVGAPAPPAPAGPSPADVPAPPAVGVRSAGAERAGTADATRPADADQTERHLPAPRTPAHAEPPDAAPPFTIHLTNFEGPFDLLLGLIAKHKLDVTEVALSHVTNEFIAHIRAMGPDWDLDVATEFLVVAATLLDLKAARLLPAAEVEDEEDLALLEARDLLFARLLQYRAYKRIAEIFAERWAAEGHRHPRTVGLEPHHAELLPEVVLRIGPDRFAALAAKAMQPKPEPTVYTEHIHAPLVSVREQGHLLVERLRAGETPITFAELSADAPDTLTVVARFLALLELYRERAVEFDQPEALGELTVRWISGTDAAPELTDEFDRPPETAEPAEAADDHPATQSAPAAEEAQQ